MGLRDSAMMSSYSYIKDPRGALAAQAAQPQEQGGGPEAIAMAMAMDGKRPGRRNNGGLGNLGQPSGSIEELLWQTDGHYNHLHFASEDLPMKRIARKLEKRGLTVGELEGYKGTGQVTGGHSPNSHHYTGNALDLNYYGGAKWANEKEALDWAYNWLRRKFG